MRHVLRLLFVCFLAVFAGCRTPPYEGRYDFYEGLRKGEVTEIQALAEIHSLALPTCEDARSPKAAASSSPWAVIRYFRLARLSFTSVALAQMSLKVGDRVYVNPTACPVQVVLRKVD